MPNPDRSDNQDSTTDGDGGYRLAPSEEPVCYEPQYYPRPPTFDPEQLELQRTPRFQFTLAGLMVATTAAVMLCSTIATAVRLVPGMPPVAGAFMGALTVIIVLSLAIVYRPRTVAWVGGVLWILYVIAIVIGAMRG